MPFDIRCLREAVLFTIKCALYVQNAFAHWPVLNDPTATRKRHWLFTTSESEGETKDEQDLL